MGMSKSQVVGICTPPKKAKEQGYNLTVSEKLTEERVQAWEFPRS